MSAEHEAPSEPGWEGPLPEQVRLRVVGVRRGDARGAVRRRGPGRTEAVPGLGAGPADQARGDPAGRRDRARRGRSASGPSRGLARRCRTWPTRWPRAPHRRPPTRSTWPPSPTWDVRPAGPPSSRPPVPTWNGPARSPRPRGRPRSSSGCGRSSRPPAEHAESQIAELRAELADDPRRRRLRDPGAARGEGRPPPGRAGVCRGRGGRCRGPGRGRGRGAGRRDRAPPGPLPPGRGRDRAGRRAQGCPRRSQPRGHPAAAPPRHRRRRRVRPAPRARAAAAGGPPCGPRRRGAARRRGRCRPRSAGCSSTTLPSSTACWGCRRCT